MTVYGFKPVTTDTQCLFGIIPLSTVIFFKWYAGSIDTKNIVNQPLFTANNYAFDLYLLSGIKYKQVILIYRIWTFGYLVLLFCHVFKMVNLTH